MIDPNHFIQALQLAGIEFVTGVPDSLLKDVCACITDKFAKNNHIIATNEGSAVALAMGHFLATGNPALVYLQNSGIGNMINPITSLATNEVYGIPMILLIGWRGEIDNKGTQLKDEPQHVKQGKITLKQLDLLDIPFRVVNGDENPEELISDLKKLTLQRSAPAAIVVRKGLFSNYKLKKADDDHYLLTREQILELIVQHIPEESPIVSTTGKTSRELYELRKIRGENNEKDFITVGGMGHASQIAAGIALSRPEKTVYCLDGDGAMLMHMGALAINAEIPNLKHIVLNNGAHESVGGQPTIAQKLDLSRIAKSCGYHTVMRVKNKIEIMNAVESMLNSDHSFLLEILCKTGSRSDLGRPDKSPVENKQLFMEFLKV